MPTILYQYTWRAEPIDPDDVVERTYAFIGLAGGKVYLASKARDAGGAMFWYSLITDEDEKPISFGDAVADAFCSVYLMENLTPDRASLDNAWLDHGVTYLMFQEHGLCSQRRDLMGGFYWWPVESDSDANQILERQIEHLRRMIEAP